MTSKQKVRWKTNSYHFHHRKYLQALQWHQQVLVHAPAFTRIIRPLTNGTAENGLSELQNDFSDLQHFLRFLNFSGVWMISTKHPLHLSKFGGKSNKNTKANTFNSPCIVYQLTDSTDLLNESISMK